MNPFAWVRHFGPMPRYDRVLAYQNPSPDEFISVAGPCSVESADQIHEIANALGKLGVKYLRGGLFRAGTYPGAAFGWVDEVLMSEFSRAAHNNGMRTIIEVLDHNPETFNMISKYADCYQIGARQMQNYSLLRFLSKTKRKVFLKRHPGSKLDELLGAAEHLLMEKKCEPVLVERGSSTHMDHVRWDLSISLIPAVKSLTKIPIVVDASHGTGRRDLVGPLTLAGVAAGADGFVCEVHPKPDQSLSDAQQAYPLSHFPYLLETINTVRTALKREAINHEMLVV